MVCLSVRKKSYKQKKVAAILGYTAGVGDFRRPPPLVEIIIAPKRIYVLI